MKRSIVAIVCAAVLTAILGLSACGQSLPAPSVTLPVTLASFTAVKYDYDLDLGDFKYKFELSKAQQGEFQRLLQADKWFDPGALPGRGYTSVIDAVNGAGWYLTVGYWDEQNTIIALFSDDQTEKTFYFAPFEVQEKAGEFRDKLHK